MSLCLSPLILQTPFTETGTAGRYGKTKHGLAKDWGVSATEAQATIDAWCALPACACGRGCKAPA